MWALDTNVVVRALRRRTAEPMRERFRELEPGEVLVPEIVRAELLHGCLRSGRPRENTRAVTRFLEPFRGLAFDAGSAAHYAEIRHGLEQKGELIGPNDLIIAATVRAAGATLVTNNLKEFRRVPGLECEDWTVGS